MTGYFDALIRASGLDAGRPPSAAVGDATGVQPDVTTITPTPADETDVEHVAAPLAPLEPPVAATEPTPTPPAPVGDREQIRDEPVANAVRGVVPRVPDDGTGRKTQAPPAPRAAPAAAAPAPPPRGPAAPLDHAAIVSDHERLVRAAFDWVAADPMRLPSSPTAVPDSAAASPPSSRARVPRAPTRQTTEDGAQPDPGPHAIRPQTRSAGEQVKPAPPLTPGEPPFLAVTPRAQNGIPIEPAAAVERPASRSIADRRPLEQDDVVEVSIGAIHVHVDAPAPPVAAPAPPAPRPSSPASRPARDGLRRRALRRI